MADHERKEAEGSEEECAEKDGKELSLEDAFEQLDALLEKMEEKELPLEEAFSFYQQGVELIRQCSEKIDTVEKEIQVLNGDGELDEF